MVTNQINNRSRTHFDLCGNDIFVFEEEQNLKKKTTLDFPHPKTVVTAPNMQYMQQSLAF